ncbi:Toxin RelE3 [Serratia entomophila]|uniref:type II toxin-antitoxin system RelE/ParE family toxin n=1 Tax=Serratia entomophila TaxID=42906 RepID=UPI002178CFDB|nr:type II toxin-antitoxin system RelE/ParE family toxin [Serratia entomophila]CAI1964701.1 Toxin RelE3 [Serratia entomophila]
MPQVIISAPARRDLQRLQDFLKKKNRLAAKKAAESLIRGIRQLEKLPNIGRPVEHLPLEYQERVIEFGDSGYVLLYRHDTPADCVVILSVKHQKEAGYHHP